MKNLRGFKGLKGVLIFIQTSEVVSDCWFPSEPEKLRLLLQI